MAMRVLLVEDDPISGQAALTSLQGSGVFTVTWARELDEASKRLHDGAHDAVLLDLMLPGTAGLETLRRVKEAAPRVPVVVLTGLDGGDDLGVRATAMGAADYVRKQEIAYGSLPRIVRQAVERDRLERELLDARVARPLVRRLLADVLGRASMAPTELVNVGRALGEEAAPQADHEIPGIFASLGLGELRLVAAKEGRHEFEGRDTLECRPGAGIATCHLTLGFLAGALSSLHEGRAAPGAETECQSRGAACCRFVLQVK